MGIEPSRVVLATLALGLASCGDSCREYSDFSCSYLDKATYTVVFSYPKNDRTETLGTVEGLSACGSVAYSFAESHHMSNASWGYVCCLHAKGSTCYEKHR